MSYDTLSSNSCSSEKGWVMMAECMYDDTYAAENPSNWIDLFEKHVSNPIRDQTNYSAEHSSGVLARVRDVDRFSDIREEDYHDIVKRIFDEQYTNPSKLTKSIYEHLRSDYTRYLLALKTARGEEYHANGMDVYKWTVVKHATHSAMSRYGLIRDVSQMVNITIAIRSVRDCTATKHISHYGLDILVWRLLKERPNTQFIKRNLMRTLSMLMTVLREEIVRLRDLNNAIELMRPVMTETDIEMVEFINQCTMHLNPLEFISLPAKQINEHCKAATQSTACIFDDMGPRNMGILHFILIISLLLLSPFMKLYDVNRTRRLGWNHKLAIGNRASLAFGKLVAFTPIPKNLHRPLLEAIAKSLLPLESDLNSRKSLHLRQQAVVLTRAIQSVSDTEWDSYTVMKPDHLVDIVSGFEAPEELDNAKHHLLNVLGTLAAFAGKEDMVSGLNITFAYMYVAHVKLKDTLAGVRKGSVEMDVNTWLTV